jgi:hypothetical protein
VVSPSCGGYFRHRPHITGTIVLTTLFPPG